MMAQLQHSSLVAEAPKDRFARLVVQDDVWGKGFQNDVLFTIKYKSKTYFDPNVSQFSH